MGFNASSLTSVLNKLGIQGGGGGGSNPFSGKKDSFEKTNYSKIIGLPPLEWCADGIERDIVQDRILRSMLTMFIKPSYPSYSGITGDKGNLFQMDTAAGEDMYKQILSACDVKKNLLGENGLQVAVLNDSAVSESWSHDYSESMFEGMLQGMGGMAGEIRQITGKDLFSGTADILKNTGSVGSELAGGGGISSIIETLTGGAADMLTGVTEKLNALKSQGGRLGDIASKAAAVATGSQVDFPMIWKGSSYSPSYSFTTILYCPDMGNEKLYLERIVDPLIHLLAFMCPRSDDNDLTYTFPLLMQVKCPGLFMIDAGYISQLDVVKGGQGQDISFDQRSGTVEVRFTLSPLYSTMISKQSFNAKEERPTLQGYAFAMRGLTNKSGEPSIPKPSMGSGGAGSISSSSGDNRLIEFVEDAAGGIFRNISTQRKRNLAENAGLDLESSIERLSIADKEASSDSSINGSKFAELQEKYGKYNDDIINIIGNSKAAEVDPTMTTAKSIALRIQSGEVINDPSVANWFWNNLDRFTPEIQSIVEGITPGDIIAQQSSTFKNQYGQAIDEGDF